MKIAVKSYDLFNYLSVFEVVEWRGEFVYRTRDTGKFIRACEQKKLDSKKYIAISISTKLLKMDEVELELFL